MKTFLQKLRTELQHFLYLHFHDFTKQHPPKGLAGDMVKIRTVQAIAAGQKDVMVIGDSRLHEFEPLFNEIKNTISLPISGSTVAGWLQFWHEIVWPCRPKIIVCDADGNDFLQGRSVNDVLKDVLLLIKNMSEQMNARILYYETSLLGAGAYPGVNYKLTEFNAKLAGTIGQDFIPVNDILSDGKFMLPKYDCGDHVHHSEAAYQDAYGPRLKEKLISLGMPV